MKKPLSRTMNWWTICWHPSVKRGRLLSARFHPHKNCTTCDNTFLMYSWAIPPDGEFENVTDITEISVYKMAGWGEIGGEQEFFWGVCLNYKRPQSLSGWYSPDFSVPHNMMLFWRPDVGIGGCKTTQQLWCRWTRWPAVTSSHPSNHWPSLATSWLGKHPQASGKSFHSSCKHSWTLTSLPSPCVTLDNPGSSRNLETAATEAVVLRAKVVLKKQKCRISDKN